MSLISNAPSPFLTTAATRTAAEESEEPLQDREPPTVPAAQLQVYIPPWDSRRWPEIPVPEAQRIYPTIESEGGIIRAQGGALEPSLEPAQGFQESQMFVNPQGIRCIQGDTMAHPCDEYGRRIIRKIKKTKTASNNTRN